MTSFPLNVVDPLDALVRSVQYSAMHDQVHFFPSLSPEKHYTVVLLKPMPNCDGCLLRFKDYHSCMPKKLTKIRQYTRGQTFLLG